MAISFGVDGAGVAYMTEAIWQVSDFVPVEICAEPGKSVLQFGGLGLMLLLSAVAVTDTNYFREENVSSVSALKRSRLMNRSWSPLRWRKSTRGRPQSRWTRAYLDRTIRTFFLSPSYLKLNSHWMASKLNTSSPVLK